MKFELISTNSFLAQLKNYTSEEHRKIREKLLLAEQNPFRNKAVSSKEFSHAFRIRINLQNKDKRIIYAVVKDKVVVAGILDRDKDYKDMDALLKKVKEETFNKNQ